MGNRRAVLDGQGDTLSVLSYNLLNLPKEYRLADGAKERYVYSADGEKLYVQHVTSSNVTTGTEYAANYRFENGSIAMIHTDAGYYTPVPPPSGSGSPTYMHVWYLKDHLGNNRVLADGTGTALRKHHYDPFGEAITLTGAAASPFPTGATESPYKYGGKEWDSTTSSYDFEARQFSPNFHRFTTMDPLCEKYYGISPYAYCANNPVNLVDPEGSHIWGLNSSGEISLLETNDDIHELVVLNGDNEITDRKFSMENDDVFEALEGNSGTSSYMSSLSQGCELMKLFFFLSDNTSIEWAIHQNDSEVALGTIHDKYSAGDWKQLGLTYRPSFSMHSHPDISPTRYDEFFSMGMVATDNTYKSFRTIENTDWFFIQTYPETKAREYLVYFPDTNHFYKLAYPKKVNSKTNLFRQYRSNP